MDSSIKRSRKRVGCTPFHFIPHHVIATPPAIGAPPQPEELVLFHSREQGPFTYTHAPAPLHPPCDDCRVN
ncbi:hypothetical protein BD779DRAFT_1605113 [Infundibulicybe gibba]|nr:hypothetical protein BD779DRAFT_1605113 [Infundibulicybe gibba]